MKANANGTLDLEETSWEVEMLEVKEDEEKMI